MHARAKQPIVSDEADFFHSGTRHTQLSQAGSCSECSATVSAAFPENKSRNRIWWNSLAYSPSNGQSLDVYTTYEKMLEAYSLLKLWPTIGGLRQAFTSVKFFFFHVLGGTGGSNASQSLISGMNMGADDTQFKWPGEATCLSSAYLLHSLHLNRHC